MKTNNSSILLFLLLLISCKQSNKEFLFDGERSVVWIDKMKRFDHIVIAYYDEFVDNAFWVSHYSFVNANNCILYNKPIDNEILVLSGDGLLEKIVEFDFGKMDVPKEHRKEIEKNIKSFDSYNLLKWITIVEDNYFIGTFWENRETKSFFIDRKKNEMYVSDSTIDQDISSVAGYENKILMQHIIPGSEKAEEDDLPEDIKECLSNGDYVLVLYQLI